jgi:hypothetical protein
MIKVAKEIYDGALVAIIHQLAQTNMVNNPLEKTLSPAYSSQLQYFKSHLKKAHKNNHTIPVL